MINFKQRKQRLFEDINDIDEIFQLLKTKFFNKPMTIKYDVYERALQINDYDETDKTVKAVTDETFEVGDDKTIMVAGLLDKYFEVDFEVTETYGPGYFKCAIKSARRATTGRQDLRFKVKEGDAAATNFRVSKHTIDLSSLSIPTSIKVILDQYTSQKKDKYDIFETGYFNSEDPIIKHIKKTGQSLFIEDMNIESSYTPLNDDFIDMKSVLGGTWVKYVSMSREKGYKSMMIVPLLYLTDTEQSIPFAYIKAISKQNTFNIENILGIKEEAFKLVDRIREANTVLIDKKQKLVDISRGGARIAITDDELKRYMVKTKGFVFDLVFKLQQPITIYGEIKFSGLDENNNVVIGLSFAGNSSRKNEMTHLYSLLKPMELEYKKRLIASMKARQGIK